MSLYVQPENQHLLWNTVHKIPNIQIVPTNERENWFKNIIKTIYENNRHRKLSSSDLKELNKQTIQYIAQTLNAQSAPKNMNNISYAFDGGNYGSPVSPTPPMSSNPILNSMRPIQPLSDVKGTRHEGYTMEVANRQKEYDNMLKREVPPEPNFKEMVEDKAIENMEELLKQQLRQRELDIQTPGIIQPMKPVQPKPTSKRVKIIEKLDLSNTDDTVNIDDIHVVNMDESTKPQLMEFNEKLDAFIQLMQEMRTEIHAIGDRIHAIELTTNKQSNIIMEETSNDIIDEEPENDEEHDDEEPENDDGEPKNPENDEN